MLVATVAAARPRDEDGGLKGEGGTWTREGREEDEGEGRAPEENGEVVGVWAPAAGRSCSGLVGELTVMLGTTGRSVPVTMADKSLLDVVIRPFAAEPEPWRGLRLMNVVEGDGASSTVILCTS